MGRRRGALVAALALTLVASSGAVGYVATREDDEATRDDGAAVAAASNQEKPGWGERLSAAAKHLVGGGSGRANAEPVNAGLAVSQQLPPGKTWPAQKRVREVTSKRTANGKVYQLSDGRLQAEISQVPVNYRDGKGKYQPIDTRVKATGRAGYVQGNSTNSFTSLFGDRSDNLVRFEKDGRSVELGLTGAAKNVTPKVSGSTVTYPGVAGGADLTYEVSSTELKEKIVLKRAPSGPVSFKFSLDTKGLTAVSQPDGSIAFQNGSGARALTIPAPFMYDGAGTTSAKVTQKVTGSTITVSADATWLADAGRKYPVVVDPTIMIQPNPTDSRDAEISSSSPDKAYGDVYPLSVGTDAASVWRSLLRFSSDSMPKNVPIDDAQLQLYYDQSLYTYAYDVPMEAREITQPWNSWTEDPARQPVTWNTAPQFATTPAGNSVTVDDGDSNTAAVGTWTASGNTTLTAKAVGNDYRFNNDTTTGHTYTYVPTITEAGDYLVEVHYVGSTVDRPTNAPYTVYYNGGSKAYTVDQTTPDNDGAWKTLGVHPFVAGTTGKVVLGDVSGKSVIADAVRFTKTSTVKRNAKSSLWMSFPVRSVVQKWVNGGANNGVVVKAVDEADKGRGGAIFEGSEYAYNNARRDYNLPKLVVTYGTPGVAVNPPATITSTGALLSWPAYTGTDIAEYQVHRSIYQTYTPSSATLVAPVAKGTTSFQDTTATPTPAAETDILKRKFFYYMVVVKTTDGKLIAGPTVSAMLPKAGQITKFFRSGVTDTTLSATKPTTNVNVYDGDPYVSPGNNSTLYGDTRGLVKFPVSGVPANAQVVDAQLEMWNTNLYPGTDIDEYVDVHKLTRAFDQTKATWNTSDGTTAWTKPGGDYDATALSANNTFTNDPKWMSWNVTTAAKSWVTTPASNYGLLLKQRDEVNQTARAMLLSAEAPEPLLRPTLEVTYLEQTAESTYYAAQLPEGAPPATTFTTPVSISNPTQAAWNATDWQLSYTWTRADGSAVVGSQAVTPLPASVPVGGTVDLTATVTTPPSTDEGNKKTDYTISWEMKNKTTGQTLSQVAGIAPLAQNIAVVEPTSDQLGLEDFYSYAGKNTGAGGSLMNNLYAGNTVWQYNAFSNPGRGLSSFVRLAYNSLDTTDTVSGFGWSLQASSMMRLGSPLDFHPNPHPTQVTFTDGDGTSHWFTLDSASGQWVAPKGVHLYLQQKAGVDCKPNTEESQAWSLTRPDRTQFFYDCDGYLTSTVDKNGNTMTFTYEERKSNNKPTKFLRYVTDPSSRQTITVDYFAKGDSYDYIDDTTWTRKSATGLTNPKIIDHVKTIKDVSGRTLTFTYTDKGLLGELVDGAGSTNGTPKTFKFQYDMTQGNKNVKLVKVTDPRGNATNLVYNFPSTGDDPQWHWRTKSYTDRLGYTTQFAYTDPDGPQGTNIDATVLDAENHTTAYRMDGYGRPYQTTNAKNQVTKLAWDDQHNVISLTEDNGAVAGWSYDAKTGYPTEVKDALAVKNNYPGTVLTYNTQLNGYVADLATKTSPEGRKWSFTYTTAGDLATVTDGMGNSTPTSGDYTASNTYDAFGLLRTSKDANGNTTLYDDYDDNGYPQTITDAKTEATKYVYDVRGQVTKVTDPLGKDTTQTYDTFGRPLVNTVPEDQAAGIFITTPAPVYDANDNVTQATQPNGAVMVSSYDANDRLTYQDLPRDTSTSSQRRASYTYDKLGHTLTRTEPLGNLTPSDPDDYVTRYGYDAIYEQTSVTDAADHTTTYSYDDVGNVTTMVDGRRNATPDTSDFTSKYEYNLAHLATAVTDAAGYTTRKEYDKDGLVVADIDQDGNRTLTTLDARGNVSSVRVPHVDDNGTIGYNTTTYEYDQVGNQTKVTSPRGVVTTDDPNDFAQITTYDELNRVKEQNSPYDKDDSRYNTPDKTVTTYDAAGRVLKVSAPPSDGQTVRNDTTYSYLDNGWTKASTDPWDITTSYTYNELGLQTSTKVTSAGGSSSRNMGWDYYPDGKPKSRTDDGVPVGSQVVMVDDSDFQNVTTNGAWTSATTGSGFQGYDYLTHPSGTGTNSAAWTLNVPQAGDYEVFVKYATGTATNAPYTIAYNGGSTTKAVDQTKNAGAWVSLGKYAFAEGNTQRVTLTDAANGTVVADSVKLVRDNHADVDTESKTYDYGYDVNGNLTSMSDTSPGTPIDEYALTYTGLNQVQKVLEEKSGSVVHTTTYGYDENGNMLTRGHDNESATYEYDPRDLLSKVTDKESATDTSPKVTSYTYTSRGDVLRETKGNGNTVDFAYYLDSALRQKVEKKSDGTIVSQDTIDYDPNGNQSQDVSKKMNADNHSAYLDRTTTWSYDPRDRVTSVGKKDGSGSSTGSESYTYDPGSNVINQTVSGVTTTFRYDRNRLMSNTDPNGTATYNYDPFGRVDTVTSGGSVIERMVYDGFDRTVEHRKNSDKTTYTYDPLDRTATETQHAGASNEKATTYDYLGLSDQTLTESSGGKIDKSYQYSPWGERLSQVKTTDSGEKEDSYYGYDPHTDVDQITDDKGDTRSTYGYTAYGASDDKDATGVDKPDPADPTKQEYNAYRYNAKRWDAGSGTYDMGFRDYDPGLNRFLTRDSYSGALADMGLSTDPWTMNRYAFAGGNPISNVEIDGHFGWSSITNFVSDHSDQIRDAAVTAAGVAMMGVGMGGEALGVALDATGVGAIAGVPINIAAAGLISLGAATTVAGVAAFAMDTANYSGGSSSSSSGGDAPKVERAKGSQQGAEDLQKRAADLQGKRSWGGGTTSVVKVQNVETGEVQTWISTEGKTLPKEWQGLLDEQSGDRFIPGSGHAEQTIVDNLGDDWKIVEGGTSRNVCITHPTGACEGALKGADPDLVIDGQKYRWRAPGVKTDYRTFWWAG